MIYSNNNTVSYTPSIPLESLAYQDFSHNPQQLDTTQNTCPSCGVIAPHTLTLQSPQSPHYASLKCQECNRFIKWVGKPQKERERNERSRLIKAWLNNSKLSLNDWERSFLTNISSAKKLSPNQEQCFSKIYARLGGVA